MASSRRPQPRPARPASQGRRYPQQPPAKAAAAPPTWTTRDAGPLRTKIELASRRPLIMLSAAPRWLLFLGFLALAVGAGVAPGVWGALCALVIAGFLSWLAFLAWPKLTTRSRAMRVIVVGVLLAAVVFKLATG